MKRSFYFYGWLYSSSIDFLLKKLRKKVAEYAHRYNLFPLLDLCCGTGAQCRFLSASQNPVFGLDLDFKMMVYAASKSPQIPYMCADASSIPLKALYLKGIVLSYALHEKHPDIRHEIISEALKLLGSSGKIIFLDYDLPWNTKSRLAMAYNSLIEMGAGFKHHKYFQDFLQKGGITSFINHENFKLIEYHDVDWACSRMILAEST